MTYYARRYYGRTKTAQIVVNGRELLAANQPDLSWLTPAPW